MVIHIAVSGYEWLFTVLSLIPNSDSQRLPLLRSQVCGTLVSINLGSPSEALSQNHIKRWLSYHQSLWQ